MRTKKRNKNLSIISSFRDRVNVIKVTRYISNVFIMCRTIDIIIIKRILIRLRN